MATVELTFSVASVVMISPTNTTSSYAGIVGIPKRTNAVTLCAQTVRGMREHRLCLQNRLFASVIKTMRRMTMALVSTRRLIRLRLLLLPNAQWKYFPRMEGGRLWKTSLGDWRKVRSG